jgi:hypothetical protein
MSYQCSPFSKSTGTGKLAQLSGATLALFAGIFIACAFTVRGQDPVPEEPLPSSTDDTAAQTDAAPPKLGGLGSGNLALGGQTVSSSEVTSTQPRRFHYRFGLTVRGVYDDNIFLTNTNKVDGWYFAIEPMLTLGIGDIEGRSQNYLRLDYIPSIILYSDHSDNGDSFGRGDADDGVSHLINIEGGHRFGRLSLSLSQQILILDGTNLNSVIDTTGLLVNLDASQPTRLNLFTTRLRADYDLTGKISLSGEFDAAIYDYPDFFSNQTLSWGLYINYMMTPKVTLGVGGTFGVACGDSNVHQTFEQANFRISYQVTGKFGLSASAGVEFRQFDSGQSDYVTPVFELGAIYNPFDGTTISLAAGRRILPSGFLANQDFGTTYFVGRVQQRLLRRLHLGLAVGYENSDYIATVPGVSATRDDDYFFISPSLDVLINRWLSVGVYYLHRENSSNIPFLSFDNNQVGLRATVRF